MDWHGKPAIVSTVTKQRYGELVRTVAEKSFTMDIYFMLNKINFEHLYFTKHGSTLHMKRKKRLNWLRNSTCSIYGHKLLRLSALGKSKPKYTWQSLTIWILLVLNNFMKKRFTGKSKDLRSDLVNGQTSRLYTRTGIHLLLISWIITFSDAILPILPNIALAAR